MKKVLVAGAALVAVLACASGAIADPGGPTLTGIGVYASDGGGWDTYPTSTCGEFHLFIAENGDPVGGSLEETIDDQLAVGTTTLGIIGTDGNGPGTTQRADLVIDGQTLTVPNHGSASATFDGDVVTASLSWSNKSDGALPYVDRVAVCGQYADGYQDSYGTLTLTVTPADTTPPAIAFAGNAGTYSVDQTVAITCSATDAQSGVASLACPSLNGVSASSFGVGAHTFTATATDGAGNTSTASVTFTVTAPTPAALGSLTQQFVQGSPAYAALEPQQQRAVNVLANVAAQAVASIVPRLNPAQKAVFERLYASALSSLVRGGWLSAGQAQTLETLAAGL